MNSTLCVVVSIMNSTLFAWWFDQNPLVAWNPLALVARTEVTLHLTETRHPLSAGRAFVCFHPHWGLIFLSAISAWLINS